MKNNSKLGAGLAVLGILTGLLFFYLIAAQYNPVIDAHALVGRTDEATSVSITFAVLGWLGITAGAIWAAVFYGFLRKEKWAWFCGDCSCNHPITGRILSNDPRHGWRFACLNHGCIHPGCRYCGLECS